MCHIKLIVLTSGFLGICRYNQWRKWIQYMNFLGWILPKWSILSLNNWLAVIAFTFLNRIHITLCYSFSTLFAKSSSSLLVRSSLISLLSTKLTFSRPATPRQGRILHCLVSKILSTRSELTDSSRIDIYLYIYIYIYIYISHLK